MKKQILSIAILATLPLTAMADNPVVSVGPAAVPSNGTAVVATANPPYQTLTPTNDDKQHIASTAYVKGAYNDSIAAVNKLNNDKQAKLQNSQNNNTILPKVMSGSDFNTLGTALVNMGTDSKRADEYAAMTADIAYQLTGEGDAAALNDTLISAGAVMQFMREAGDEIKTKANASDVQNKLTTTVNNASQNISATVAQTVNTANPSATTLVSEAAIASAISGQATALNNKRVEIYTTWDNDNAKTEVAFVNATPAQSGQ